MSSETIFYENLTDIQQFYAGKTIFVTGGTGFIGKLVVEKLLRSCRHLKKIYLLVREKRGQSPEERLSKLLDNTAFSRVHIFNENFKKQVQLIEGCLEKDGLGISEKDRKTLRDEVNIVFHVGASVRFDTPLKYNANVNVKATREMIKLAHEIKQLKMFIYVSTAYSFSHLKNVEEKLYDVPYTPEDLMKLINETPDKELEERESEIIGQWFNSYVFTKAIAERALLIEGNGLPRAIVRPTIVISTEKEPLPGWVDVIFGPIGSVLGAALGVMHAGYADDNILADYVPADYVVNHMLTAAFYASKNNPADLKIFTCSSSLQNPIYIRDFVYWCTEIGKSLYSTKQVFHTWTVNTKNFKLFMILNTIFHVPPALLFDFILKCQGKRPIAKKMLDKVVRIYETGAKFNTTMMVFNNKNTQNMVNAMSLLDQEIFNCNISKLCWHSYLYTGIKGGRKYLFKDDNSLEGFRKGLNRANRLKQLHYVLIALLLYIVYLFIKLFI